MRNFFADDRIYLNFKWVRVKHSKRAVDDHRRDGDPLHNYRGTLRARWPECPPCRRGSSTETDVRFTKDVYEANDSYTVAMQRVYPCIL